MTDKTPVLLTVLVETGKLRWFAAGIDFQGRDLPLLCSSEGNLAAYRSAGPDDQLSFLRHRFSGVLQRGCDRLWGHRQKAVRFVFVLDGPFPDAAAELGQRVADHMVEWMANPPVTFFEQPDGFKPGTRISLRPIAGEIEPDQQSALERGLSTLFDALPKAHLWERVATPPAE